MISRRTNKFESIALLFAAVLVLPTTLKATQYEVSQLASQLGYATSLLADELRYIRGFGSVRQNADRVAREAEQLIKGIQRSRSNSYIRSQFKDISRSYSDLEAAFFRANRR
jgi:predicted Zn-dependent peptidase